MHVNKLPGEMFNIGQLPK